MSSKENLKALRLLIGNNRSMSTSKHYFISSVVLTQILTPPAIAKAVAELECAPEDVIGLAEAIQRKGTKTFAILIWMRRENAIVQFRRAGCLDSRLPLDESTALPIAPEFGREFCSEYQWQFLPHVFYRNDDRDIDSAFILPFLREIGPKEGGGFGTITRVEVHPLLQDFYPVQNDPVVVVRKSINERGSFSSRKMLFENERRSLRLLTCLRNPNIIPLLSAYTHRNDMCLLFPLIDMDLSTFLERDTRHGNFQWNFTFFSALYGLASALSHAHRIRLRANNEGLDFSGIGYHHDLRPANILVNKETFILADFGLSKVKSPNQESRTHWKAGSGDYLAPECMDENLLRQDVGRSIDIWAFGCLMAEIATFIELGADGVKKFRDCRLAPRSFSNWEDSYFYDSHEKLKDAVRQWLMQIASRSHQHGIYGLLNSLIFSVLKPVYERPTMLEVCSNIAFISSKAHFHAAFESLTSIVEGATQSQHGTLDTMAMWFERERLRAFGNASGLYADEWIPSTSVLAEQESVRCVEILKRLFHDLNSSDAAAESRAENTGTPENSDFHGNQQREKRTTAPDETTGARLVLETSVRNLIQQLWDILPQATAKKAESIWLNMMLETDDTDQLDYLSQNLKSRSPPIFQEGAAARAMMRKIRLEMLQNPTVTPELKDLELDPHDVVEGETSYGHQIGKYKEATDVVIEWMRYDKSWEKIPTSERTLVMAMKAKGFNIDPLPDSLRLLHCLGFFEKSERDRLGYGFVYQIPRSVASKQTQSKSTTLLHLLISSAKSAKAEPHLSQPLLGHRFRLAFALVQFVGEFHSIGWLHENFHSNNVVFFGDNCEDKSPMATISGILSEPYVLGIHKSRPGGEAWFTQGPEPDEEFLIYRHPDYEITKHFRVGYDYYALGLVLLEIGLWAPLKMWSNKPENRTLHPDKFRNVLVETYVPRLGPRMGEAYRNIVKLLLTDGISPQPKKRKPDPTMEHDAFRKFFIDVVGPLGELATAHF